MLTLIAQHNSLGHEDYDKSKMKLSEHSFFHRQFLSRDDKVLTKSSQKLQIFSQGWDMLLYETFLLSECENVRSSDCN